MGNLSVLVEDFPSTETNKPIKLMNPTDGRNWIQKHLKSAKETSGIRAQDASQPDRQS